MFVNPKEWGPCYADKNFTRRVGNIDRYYSLPVSVVSGVVTQAHSSLAMFLWSPCCISQNYRKTVQQGKFHFFKKQKVYDVTIS